jgi:DNA-binding CsgD family transcriptional regulator
LADVALLRRDYGRAIALGEEAVARWRRAGYIWGIAQALGTVAAARYERGDVARAAALYDETLSTWLACDDGRGIAGTLAGIAAVAGGRGQLERSARLLGSAWSLARRLGVRYLAHQVYAERVLAAVRARLDAETFDTAWADGQRLTLPEAVDDARAALTGWVSKESHGLSPREVEVLRLLVGGFPDREIAAQLSVSPRTVQTHVANLFAKLGVNSRAEAAAIAVRRGLV